MNSEIPQLVLRSAEKSVRDFCSEPITFTGKPCRMVMEEVPGGFEILASTFDSVRMVPLARLLYSPELDQWALHRPRPGNRWSYVPEAGGSLDPNRLLRYLRDDPLNIFR